MGKLKKLDDSNSLFIKVSMPDGTECLHAGTIKEISDSLGFDAPWQPKSLLDMVKRVYDGCTVSQITAKEAKTVMKKVQDSKSTVVLY